MDLIKQIYRKGVLVLVPLAVVSAFIEWKKLPAGILVGGALGLANIKGLAWGVRGLLGGRPGGRVIFFSVFRLLLLFAILSLLVYLRLVNVLGILVGFTVIFSLVMIEGLRYAKNADRDDP